MTSELQVFEYKGASVRTVIIDGEPWMVAKDVCEVLGIQNHKDAIAGLDEDEKSGVAITDPHGREQITNVINEPGLYKLTFKSRKPSAKEFTRWVTHDVLPTIRKTGSYTLPNAETSEDMEPLNIRVRIAGVLQRLALQVSSKVEREIINREAYKYATGHELPVTNLFAMSSVAILAFSWQNKIRKSRRVICEVVADVTNLRYNNFA